MSAEVFIGLGGNLGEVRATFEKALQKLEGFSQVKKVSSLYRSKPYGFEDQPDFLNAAALIATELEPLPLLAELQAIENELGKQLIRENGPRAIDLDLLFYGDLVLKTEELEVPHPGIAERDFVLAPLAELDPDFRHPVLGQSAKEILNEVHSLHVNGPAESWSHF